MDISIKSGTVEVIASGIVITFNKNPIEITLDPTHKKMKLILVFLDDESKEDSSVKPRYIEPTTLEITFKNFKNSMGSGSTAPIPFAKLDGRQLYLNYRIYTLENVDKTFEYTIYRDDEMIK